MVKRLCNPKTFGRRCFLFFCFFFVFSSSSSSWSVCVRAHVHVHALSSGGTCRLCQCNSVGDIAAVCTTSSPSRLKMLFLHWQRLYIWAPSILLLFSSLLLLRKRKKKSFFFFLFLHFLFYLTALNCCSLIYFLSEVRVGWRCCERTAPWHLHFFIFICCAYLKTNGETFSFFFFLKKAR